MKRSERTVRWLFASCIGVVGVTLAFTVSLGAQANATYSTPYLSIRAPRIFVKSDRKGGGLDFITGPPHATVGLMIEVIPLTEFKNRSWTTLREYFETIHKVYVPYRIRDQEWGMSIEETKLLGVTILTQKSFLYLGTGRLYFVSYRYEPVYARLEPQFKAMVESIQIKE